MELNNEHFKYKECWESEKGYDSEGNILNLKVPFVLKSIPDDVNTILDVGCGNGIITNKLHEQYRVVGVDFSEEALKHVKAETLLASAESIPVNDFSFDMVFSSQLLEHIEEPALTATIKEFKRITKKYILITVPNDEFLKKNETRCPSCNHVFNVIGHLNTFTPNKIVEMFGNDFRLLKEGVFGKMHLNYNPLLMKIRQGVGNRYFNPVSFTICPKCKNTNFPMRKGNLVSKLTNGLNRIISTQKPYWLLVLMERK